MPRIITHKLDCSLPSRLIWLLHTSGCSVLAIYLAKCMVHVLLYDGLHIAGNFSPGENLDLVNFFVRCWWLQGQLLWWPLLYWQKYSDKYFYNTKVAGNDKFLSSEFFWLYMYNTLHAVLSFSILCSEQGGIRWCSQWTFRRNSSILHWSSSSQIFITNTASSTRESIVWWLRRGWYAPTGCWSWGSSTWNTTGHMVLGSQEKCPCMLNYILYSCKYWWESRLVVVGRFKIWWFGKGLPYAYMLAWNIGGF